MAAFPAPFSPRRPGQSRRRFWLILGAGAVVIIAVASLHGVLVKADSFPAPSEAAMAGLSLPQRVVAIAESQVGYDTRPSSFAGVDAAVATAEFRRLYLGEEPPAR